MKTLNTILKGILLWSTGIVTIGIIMSLDSIYQYNDFSYFVAIIALDIVAIVATVNCLTEEEFKHLSGYNLYMKAFNDVDK